MYFGSEDNDKESEAIKLIHVTFYMGIMPMHVHAVKKERWQVNKFTFIYKNEWLRILQIKKKEAYRDGIKRKGDKIGMGYMKHG